MFVCPAKLANDRLKEVSLCVLFMDEATSHLDKENEAKISEQIQHLPITRIMIAHRQETINMAEQV